MQARLIITIKGYGNLIPVCKIPKKATKGSCAVKKSRKFSGFVMYFMFKRPVHLQQLKEMQSSKLGV